MERIIIERYSMKIPIIIVMAMIAFATVTILLTGFGIQTLLAPLSLIILLGVAITRTRSKKEIIIIGDEGLTINGNIMLGPIPWDCVSGAKMIRILFDKHLIVNISNTSKMQDIFGEEAVRKKVGKKEGSNESTIFVNLDFCKLRGIDLATLIQGHAKG